MGDLSKVMHAVQNHLTANKKASWGFRSWGPIGDMLCWAEKAKWTVRGPCSFNMRNGDPLLLTETAYTQVEKYFVRDLKQELLHQSMTKYHGTRSLHGSKSGPSGDTAVPCKHITPHHESCQR